MSDSYYLDWGTDTRMDIVWTLLGEKLGEGAFRTVFTCAFDPTLVVKIENKYEEFHNVREWTVWNEIRWDEDKARWFAPPVHISPCGRVLIQKRTEPVPGKLLEKMQAKIPKFFTDIKPGNWGLLNGKVVCHDFAYNIPTDAANEDKWWRMVKAHWIDKGY